jgi:hypothetical protein
MPIHFNSNFPFGFRLTIRRVAQLYTASAGLCCNFLPVPQACKSSFKSFFMAEFFNR